MATPDGQIRRKTRFPDRRVKEQNTKSVLKEFANNLAMAIEFLIHQGHSFESVSNYNVPQIFAFLQLTMKRDSAKSIVEFTSRLLAARGKDENVKEFYKRFQ